MAAELRCDWLSMNLFDLLTCCFPDRTIISVPPTDLRVIKGTTATLLCNATHDPRVNVRSASSPLPPPGPTRPCAVMSYRHCCRCRCSFRWDRSGVTVPPSSVGRVSVRRGTLTIGQTWSGDIGDYTCTVTSQAGNDSSSARLEVM